MKSVYPRIKDISSVDWDGNPFVSAAPLRLECHLEIGDKKEVGADFFTLDVVNRAWALSHLKPNEVPDQSPSWLTLRAVLFSDAPSFQEILDCVCAIVDMNEAYSSWPEFAAKAKPYLKWEYEGLPYPPMT